MRRIRQISFIILLFIITSSCSINYSFRTASIDYELTKTLSIAHFINQAPLVYPPLEQRFNESMVDMFTRNTRLQLVQQNAEIRIHNTLKTGEHFLDFNI